MERRVNRATTSIFRFENDLTIGSLTHTILLHEMVPFSTCIALTNQRLTECLRKERKSTHLSECKK